MAKKRSPKVKVEGALEETLDPRHEQVSSKIVKRLTASQNYHSSQGFYEDWPEYDRFWNGKQWPQQTERTKKYPRPMINHFASIIEQKVAALVYDSPEIYFEPMDAGELPEIEIEPLGTFTQIDTQNIDAAEALSHVAKHQWSSMEMDDLMDEVCRNAALTGTGIFFMPWDDTVHGGGKKAFVGDIVGDEVDPLNFFPGDPKRRDVQSQPYILITERIPLSEVRGNDSYNADMAALLKGEKGDTRDMYDQEAIEMDETDYVNLIHQWEKIYVEDEDDDEDLAYTDDEGEVQKVKRLKKMRLDYTVVCQNKVLREEKGIYEHGLYPFAAFNWYPRKKSFFGKSEAVDLINAQKEDNKMSGLQMLTAYKMGMPNMRYNPNFVKKKDLPDGPGGGKIPDNSPPGHRGVDFIQPPTAATNIPGIRATNIEGMKDASGVHEAWAGKAPGARLNASAIIALQEAAGVKVRGIQRRLFKALREVSRIWLAHWKEFHTEDRFFRIVGEGRAQGAFWFKTSQLEDMEFDVKVQGGTASPYTNSIASEQFERMLERQVIGPMEYLEHIPSGVVPKAHHILAKREQKRLMEEQKLWQKQQELTMQMVQQLIGQAQEEGVVLAPESIQFLMEQVQEMLADSPPVEVGPE